MVTKEEKSEEPKFTLFELEKQWNGLQKWSIATWGPVVYLHCNSDMANFVVNAMNEYAKNHQVPDGN